MKRKFPVVNYRQITRVAKKLGFYLYKNTRGSHEIWKKDDVDVYTTIPNHGSTPLKRKTLKSIIKDFGITVDVFSKLM